MQSTIDNNQQDSMRNIAYQEVRKTGGATAAGLVSVRTSKQGLRLAKDTFRSLSSPNYPYRKDRRLSATK